MENVVTTTDMQPRQWYPEKNKTYFWKMDNL
jgi:hypothetical protein